MNHFKIYFTALVVLVVMSACNGELVSSGLLGHGSMLNAGADVDEAGYADNSDVSLIDDSEAGYQDSFDFENGSASAEEFNALNGNAMTNNADATDDDDLSDSLLDDASVESTGLIGTGGMTPEQIPVTMSKADPEDEDCNQDTAGEILVVVNGDEGDYSAQASLFKVFRKALAQEIFYQATVGHFLQDMDLKKLKEDEPAFYQCQVSFDDDDAAVYEWIEIPSEDAFDFFVKHSVSGKGGKFSNKKPDILLHDKAAGPKILKPVEMNKHSFGKDSLFPVKK